MANVRPIRIIRRPRPIRNRDQTGQPGRPKNRRNRRVRLVRKSRSGTLAGSQSILETPIYWMSAAELAAMAERNQRPSQRLPKIRHVMFPGYIPTCQPLSRRLGSRWSSVPSVASSIAMVGSGTGWRIAPSRGAGGKLLRPAGPASPAIWWGTVRKEGMKSSHVRAYENCARNLGGNWVN